MLSELINWFRCHDQVTYVPPVQEPTIRPEIRELILHIRDHSNKWTNSRVDYDYRTTRWAWRDVEVDYVLSPGGGGYIILTQPAGVVQLTQQERALIKLAFDERMEKIRAQREREQLNELHMRLNRDVAISP